MSISKLVTQLIRPSGRMAEIFDVLVLGRLTWMYLASTTRMVAHGHACIKCSEVPPTKRLQAMSEVRSAGCYRRRY